MKYFFLIISGMLAASCGRAVTTFSDPSSTDSITVYCERTAFESFAAVSAKEFAEHHRQMPSVVIRGGIWRENLKIRV